MSQAIELQLTCPQCNTEFSHPAHTVVDMADEADSEALWQLQNGTLNRVECPKCQAGGLIPIPVLLNVPEQEKLIIFAPNAYQLDDEQLGQMIGPVLQNFITELDPEQQKNYMMSPVVTDDLSALQAASRGELSLDDLMAGPDDEDEGYDDEEYEEDENGEGDLSPEEREDLVARMNLLQQLFQAEDSLQRISMLRAHKEIVDEMFLEVISLLSDQAQDQQPELIPILQKIMNESEVFIATNQA